MVIMGVGGGLSTDLSPGDLVVGTEAGSVACPSAPILAGELRRAGLPVRTGRITTVDHLVRRSERAKLAAEGALLADMESGAAGRRGGRAPGGRDPGRVRHPAPAAGRPRLRRAGRAAVAAGRRAGGAAVGGGVRHAPGAAGRAPVVLRGRGAGHRDRRARAGAAGRAHLRAQADRAQHPRGRRPGKPRRGVRRRAGRGARRRDRGVLRARRVACGPRGGGPPGAGRDRRDLPAGVQGARRGPAVRRRRLHGGADRPRRPRGGRGHAGRGARLPPSWSRRPGTSPRCGRATASGSPT